MLARVMSVGLLAGLLAGLLIAVLQQVTTTPLILLAETYEKQDGTWRIKTLHLTRTIQQITGDNA